MKINTNEINNKEKRELYSHLWGKKDFSFEVVKNGKTDKSYEFVFGGYDLITMVGKSIARNFSIEEDTEFLDKFRMACSGTGDELKKITTLHSSSLCSLLFFYNVKNTPVEIDEYRFNESYFEFKNKVIGYPSNVDVVLLGENANTKKKAILFLESKFSEFITGVTKGGRNFEIGKSYFNEKSFSKPIYDKLFDDGILKKENENHVSAKKETYIEGIKQMISHYYGIRNFIEKKFYDEELENQKKVIEYYNSDCEIILGEILFDNLSENQEKNYLNPYIEDYKKLSKIINMQIKSNNVENFKMLEEPLKYSNLKNLINPAIRNFYFGE